MLNFSIYLQVACVVHSAYIDDDGEHVYLFTPEANAVRKSVLKSCLPAGEDFIDLMFDIASEFNCFQLSSSETALFSALILICPGMIKLLLLKNSQSFVDVIILMYLDHEDVQSVATLNSMQTSIKTSLVTEMSLLRSRDSFVLNNLLAFIDKLRLLSSEHRKLLTVLKEMPNMSQNEMFGLIE